jgi:hypothetical protein
VPDWLADLTARVRALGASGGLWIGVALSVGLAVATLAIAAAVVVTWPIDRFKRGARPAVLATHSAPLRALAHVGKNLAGAVLVLLGLIMALPGVPGQGILTMIIGLTLVDFPGKVELERRLVSKPLVRRQLNALRARFKRPPLALE